MSQQTFTCSLLNIISIKVEDTFSYHNVPQKA